MTATDELRRMLDEAGVEWDYGITGAASTRFNANGVELTFIDMRDGVTCSTILTPAQAIAATVGRGMCWLHDCDGSFSSVNRPVWRCDCGAFMTQYTDATTYHKPRYCPNCGRRCVG